MITVPKNTRGRNSTAANSAAGQLCGLKYDLKRQECNKFETLSRISAIAEAISSVTPTVIAVADAAATTATRNYILLPRSVGERKPSHSRQGGSYLSTPAKQ